MIYKMAESSGSSLFRFIQAIWSGRIPNVTQHLDQERFSK